VRNVLFVWFLTGFWHGADWTFIVWGLYFAFFLMLEKFFLSRFFSKLPALISRIYVLLVIAVSFVIFNADGMGQAISDIAGLFGAASVPLYNAHTLYYLRSYAVVIIIAVIGATPLIKNTVLRLKEKTAWNRVLNAAEPVMQLCLLVAVTAYLVDGSFNPFLYFRF